MAGALVGKTVFSNDWLSNPNWSSWLAHCSDNRCL